MPRVQFEEKQYEVAANLELGLHHPAVFATGQVLEAVVGYDVAAQQPQNAPIWQLLGVGAPVGALLSPNVWQQSARQPRAAQLPSIYVSIIFQYKRPTLLQHPRALQWHIWNAPYYRFSVYQRQHQILQHLEASVAGNAEVQYASPAFFSYNNLLANLMNRTVLPHSAFVRPSVIGAHHVWTYSQAGTHGVPNPSRRKIKLQPFERLWGRIRRRKRKEKLFKHLRSLAAEIEAPIETDELAKMMGSLRLDLSTEQIQGVADVLAVSSMTGMAGASWFVIDLG